MYKQFLMTKTGEMKYKFLFFNPEHEDYFFSNLDKNIIVEKDNYILFIDRTEAESQIFWAGNSMSEIINGIKSLKNVLGECTVSIRCGEDKFNPDQLQEVLPVFLSNGGKEIYHNIGYKTNTLDYQHPHNLVVLAEEEDTPSILGLAYNTLGKEKFGMDMTELMTYLSKDNSCAFIIKKDNEVVGITLGSIFNQGKTVFVRGLAISENHRGLGYSKHLLAKLFNWAKEKGAENSMLWVQDKNIMARRLYEKFGYYPYGDEEVLLQYIL